ncbi:endonuclease domain-containing protein [Rhizocola hellebori]|nr:DUF559 domain-containing protein [Rhizocola hellebori]
MKLPSELARGDWQRVFRSVFNTTPGRMTAHRLPRPQMQVLRKDSSGRNRYLDAYWEEHKLHVEIDGAHHMEVRHWTADMLRQNEVWLEGDCVLRFPAHLIKTQPELVMERIRQTLTGR